MFRFTNGKEFFLMNMNMRAALLGINGASDSVEEALADFGIDLNTATPEEVAQVGTAVYAALTKKYRPLIDAMPDLAKIAGKELTVVVRSFLRAMAEIAGSPELQKDLAAMQLARAQNRKSAFDAYVSVGFAPEQAMGLVLADAAVLSTSIQNAMRSTSASSSKSSS